MPIALPATLHTIAFLICLTVQSMAMPQASAWLLFHIAGCVCLIYNRPSERGIVWWVYFAWLLTISVCSFLIMPVSGGAASMWILAAMPSLALVLKKEHIPVYVKCFGTVLTLYALVLIAQLILKPSFTMYDTGTRYAWPLLDPNNAAATMNLALIPAFWAMLFRRAAWGILVVIFLTAMYATMSKAGIGVFLLSAVIMCLIKWGKDAIFIGGSLLAWAVAILFYFRPELGAEAINCFETRYPIWQADYQLMWLKPWAGFGMGMFPYYYSQVRIEHYTSGGFAHNDTMQFAMEMGIPAAMVFLCMVFTVGATMSRRSLPAALAFLAIFLQSMVEFQFYVPVVSYGAGLLLAYHRLTCCGKRNIMA